MTSRRRLASFTFSPNRGTDNNDHGSELERKLELLEARFTMPLQFQLKSHQNNSNNSNSPATLDAENSSPVSVQSSTMHAQSNQHRNNDSQQSFAFDTPSLLNTGLIEPNHNHSKANNNADHVPHRWEEVTSAHVARVQQMQESHDDSQQNTRQTSHVKTEHRHPTAGGSNEAPHSSNVPFVASPAVKNKNLSKNLTVRCIDITRSYRHLFIRSNLSLLCFPSTTATSAYIDSRGTQAKDQFSHKTTSAVDQGLGSSDRNGGGSRICAHERVQANTTEFRRRSITQDLFESCRWDRRCCSIGSIRQSKSHTSFYRHKIEQSPSACIT